MKNDHVDVDYNENVRAKADNGNDIKKPSTGGAFIATPKTMEEIEKTIKEGLVFARYPQSFRGMFHTFTFGIILLPLRLLVFISISIVGFLLFTVLNQCELETLAIGILRIQARVWLWCLGVWWIEEKDTEHKTVLPPKCVLISNHLGMHEILWFFYMYAPSFVAKKEVSKVPIIGSLARLLGCFFVQRIKDNSKRGLLLETILKASRDRKRMRLCIFPEGTTTNGNQIIRFRSGGFVPMLPVIPHIVRFEGFRRGIDFDPHYTTVHILGYILGLMAQGYLRLSIQYLPAQLPKVGDSARTYANNVQSTMSEAANLPVTSQSYSEKKALEDVIKEGHLSLESLYEIQRESLSGKKKSV